MVFSCNIIRCKLVELRLSGVLSIRVVSFQDFEGAFGGREDVWTTKKHTILECRYRPLDTYLNSKQQTYNIEDK